jgi:hypothetical protein
LQTALGAHRQRIGRAAFDVAGDEPTEHALEELAARVDETVLDRAERERAALDVAAFLRRPTAAVDGQGRHFCTFDARQPRDEVGRVESTGIGQQYAQGRAP